KKRIVSTGKQTPGIISSATADIDGDGKAEIAIAYEFAMNRPTTGKLLMAHQGAGPDDPWTLEPIADVGSIHRLRWGDVDGGGRRGAARPGRRPDLRPRAPAAGLPRPGPAPGLLGRRRPGTFEVDRHSRGRAPGDPRPRGDRRRWRRTLRHPGGVQLRRGPVP